jgi:hypothetical protein
LQQVEKRSIFITHGEAFMIHRARVILAGFLLVSLIGCDGLFSSDEASFSRRRSSDDDDSKPQATTPSTKRTGKTSRKKWNGVVMRMEFIFPEKGHRYWGTGFVVQDKKKENYLMTCAHLIEANDWKNRFSIVMHTMDHSRTIESLGTSIHVGTSVNLREVGPNGWPDMTQDLVIRPVAGDWAKPMPMAKADPRVGEWVWAVGCEAHKPLSNEKLFQCQIIEVSNGGYLMERHVEFDPHGFSGGPIVNSYGEVVGNVLAGGANIISGATITTLRHRLKAKGVKLD